MMTKIRNSWSLAAAAAMVVMIFWQGWILTDHQQARVEAQQAQEEESKRLQLIIYSAPVAIILCGPDQVIKLCNPKAGQMFGWDNEELVGQRIDVLLPEEMRERHQWQFAGAIHKMKIRGGDWMLSKTGIRSSGLRKDGTQVPVIVTVRLIKYNGKIEVVSSMRLEKEEPTSVYMPIPRNPIQQRR
jgi:PAS domain S-box-containing protein